MMKKRFLFAAALAATVSLSCAAAEVPAGPAKETEASKSAAPAQAAPAENSLAALQKKLTGMLQMRISELNPTPVKGIYEVIIDGDVLYSDETGNHIFAGQLFETATQKNLTAQTKDRLNRIDFSALPLKDAIKTVYGNGKREIAVFSDPNCAFCKRLEETLKDMKDVTIYTFLYPVIRPSSKQDSENVWCAKNPSQAWKNLMVAGKNPPKAPESCDTSAIERNIMLGTKLGVKGTPTVFVPDGSRAPGAVTLEYLEKLLEPRQSRK